MLNVNNVFKTFNPGTAIENQVLNGVSLHLEEGEFITLIGGNGAGKSTLLNGVAGTFFVDSGSISIESADMTRLPEHKRAMYLGRVFQDPMTGTAANMTIEENMAIAYRRGEKRTLRWGITQKEKVIFKEALVTLDLGLESRMSTKVGLLSGGQRQALTLLMATLKKPKVLLLDEHTAALDPKTAPKVLEISNRLIRENNLTTMMVTHNMKDAINFGTRLIMMSGGEIILDISGEDKKKLTVEDLISKFATASGEDFSDDQSLLN